MFFRYVSSSLGFLPNVNDIISTITGRSLSNVDPEVQILMEQILRSVINETETELAHNSTNETESNQAREKRHSVSTNIQKVQYMESALIT